MIMEKRILAAVLLFALTGCTQAKQVAHMDELLKLKAMSESRDEQAKYIEEQNKRFDALLETVKTDRLKEYPDKKSIVKLFGQPVFTRDVVQDGQPAEQWLYRYATKYFKSDKVYLYFDAQGKFSRFEYVPAPPEKNAAEASSE